MRRAHPLVLLATLGLFAAGDAAPARAASCNGTELATTRLFLQQVSATSAIVRWRGAADAVCAGTKQGKLTIRAAATEDHGHRQVLLTGLKPDTTYWYSVGGASAAPAGQSFRTAPKAGRVPKDGNTRLWILGDSGTATEMKRGVPAHPGEAQLVKQGFLDFVKRQGKGEPADLLLLLGDNAYLEGSDAQWQGAFFDIYPELIRTVATWPTIGNHEMGASPFDLCRFAPMPDCAKGPVIKYMGGGSEATSVATYDSTGDGPDPEGFPYTNIFALPARGEMGGAPSGTEQYYAFDYGNVHVVSLDSQVSNRDPEQRAAMRAWLVDDLRNNRGDWTIVVFHHPVYSKGENHDSDREQAEIDMRQTFAPVFEQYGVDVVYNGHSHNYERSWYLHGHYGASTTFDAKQHAELDAQGQPALGQGAEPYAQISPFSHADDKVVYTVAGSAGKADAEHPCTGTQTMGCTLPDWLQHPAHRRFDTAAGPLYRPHGIAVRGSVVLDAGRRTLISRFIDEHGNVLDEFTITRK